MLKAKIMSLQFDRDAFQEFLWDLYMEKKLYWFYNREEYWKHSQRITNKVENQHPSFKAYNIKHFIELGHSYGLNKLYSVKINFYIKCKNNIFVFFMNKFMPHTGEPSHDMKIFKTDYFIQVKNNTILTKPFIFGKDNTKFLIYNGHDKIVIEPFTLSGRSHLYNSSQRIKEITLEEFFGEIDSATKKYFLANLNLFTQ